MPRVIVADDDKDIRELFRFMFETDDIELELAEDGDAALKLQGEKPADLVITDIIMPNKGGIDLIRNLKKDYPGTKVIALSGGGNYMNSVDYLQFARLVGVDSTIEKPFMPVDLRDMVLDVLGLPQ